MFKQPGAETFNNIAIFIKNSQGFCDVNGRLVLKTSHRYHKNLNLQISNFPFNHLLFIAICTCNKKNLLLGNTLIVKLIPLYLFN